jgi:hypothetical protein
VVDCIAPFSLACQPSPTQVFANFESTSKILYSYLDSLDQYYLHYVHASSFAYMAFVQPKRDNAFANPLSIDTCLSRSNFSTACRRKWIVCAHRKNRTIHKIMHHGGKSSPPAGGGLDLFRSMDL